MFHPKTERITTYFASFVIKLILIPFFYIAWKIRIFNIIEYSTLGIFEMDSRT